MKCPKCGSEMTDRLPRSNNLGYRIDDLILTQALCMTCGHEEKVGGDRRG